MKCIKCNKVCRSPHHTTCGRDIDKTDFKLRCLEHTYQSLSLGSSQRLRDLYQEQELSFPDFRKQHGVPSKTLYWLLDYFQIPVRTISEGNNTERSIRKREETFLANYGAKNPLCSGTTAFAKRDATVKRRYGVENVRQLACVKEKITKTHLERYNTRRVVKMDGSKMNKLEAKIATSLISLGVPFQYSVMVAGHQFDFRVAENVLIECNGDFWHANPKKFNSTDVVKLPGKSFTAKELWDRDAVKAAKANDLGFFIITIWEDEADIGLDETIVTRLQAIN